MSKKVNNMVAFLKSASAEGVSKEAEHKKGTPNPQQQPGGDGTVKSHGAEHKKDKDADHVHMDMPEDEMPMESEGKKLEDKELNPKGISQPGANKGGEPKESGLSVKSASKVSNIVARIGNIKKQAADAGNTAPEGVEAAPKAEGGKGVEKKAEEAANKAGIEFNQDMLIKLANAIVSTEEGAAKAKEILEKQDGREAAAALIKSAAEQAQDNAQRQNYIEQTTNEGALHIIKLADALDPQLSEEEADFVIKSASMHQDWQNDSELDFSHPMMKQAYAQGMHDAAAMEDAAMAGEDTAAIPGGGTEPTPEDIAMVLEMAVQSGEITPEEAEAILAQLLGGAGEAAEM